jgi:L-cysteine S-thiosulfotransferase
MMEVRAGMRYAQPRAAPSRIETGVLATCVALCAVNVAHASPPVADEAAAVARGRAIAFDRARGNCLTCHVIAGGELPGNAGPALADVRERYPDRAALRAQIWDARARNPDTIMPPYGRHHILREADIDDLVAFVSTL